MVLRQDHSKAYTYAAEPKPANRRRIKGQENDVMQPANIMFDRRVVRGNTYAAQILPAEPPALSQSSVRPRRRKPAARKLTTPPPVHGRHHIDMQTDAYLEELVDVLPDKNADTQTDTFLDRPITPLFIPQKRGVDAETQIENGDLFDFNLEVEPLLEVIVGKTLEQGLMEVLEEEELAAMRAHQEHFEHIRNAELVATQKMEQAERRKVEEKERRLQQAKLRVEKEKTVREKVAASMFARGFLSGVVDSVIDSLWTKGHFQDPVEATVKDSFMPWLQQAVQGEVQKHRDALDYVSSLVSEAAGMMDQIRDTRSTQQRRQVDAEESDKARRDGDAATLASSEEERMQGAATRLLSTVIPHVVSQAKVDATRQELEAKLDEAANTEWEALKEQAANEARQKAEEQLAAAAESAAEAAADDGDAPENNADEAGPPAVDVEALVAEAVEAVAKPELKVVTDTDVLNALMEADAGLKDSMTSFMALQQLEGSWVHDSRFADELEPKDE